MNLNTMMPDKDQIDRTRRAMRNYGRIAPYLNPCSYDQGIAMIMGAIRLGWRTRDRILDEIESMSRNKIREDVETTLDTFTGDDPEQHCWFLDKAGTYHLLR